MESSTDKRKSIAGEWCWKEVKNLAAMLRVDRSENVKVNTEKNSDNTLVQELGLEAHWETEQARKKFENSETAMGKLMQRLFASSVGTLVEVEEVKVM